MSIMAVISVLITEFSASIWFFALFYKLWVLNKKKHLHFSLNFHWVQSEVFCSGLQNSLEDVLRIWTHFASDVSWKATDSLTRPYITLKLRWYSSRRLPRNYTSPPSEFSWQYSPHCCKGQLNLRKSPRCLGRRTCWQPLLVSSRPRK